jgi:tetratricopeptide (TPR) repeat protein
MAGVLAGMSRQAEAAKELEKILKKDRQNRDAGRMGMLLHIQYPLSRKVPRMLKSFSDEDAKEMLGPRLGALYLKQCRKSAQALELLSQLEAEGIEAEVLRLYRALVLTEGRDKEKGLEIFRTFAREIDTDKPDRLRILFLSGLTLLDAGELDSARALGERLKKATSTGRLGDLYEATVENTLGTRAFASGLYSKASDAFEKASALEPDNDRFRLNLAISRAMEGKMAAACELYRSLALKIQDEGLKLGVVHDKEQMQDEMQRLETECRFISTGKEEKVQSRLDNLQERIGEANSHFFIFGVSRGADPDQVEARYFQLIREYPPETHEAEFKKVEEAFSQLKDPEYLRRVMGMVIFGFDRDEALQELGLKTSGGTVLIGSFRKEMTEALRPRFDLRPAIRKEVSELNPLGRMENFPPVLEPIGEWRFIQSGS